MKKALLVLFPVVLSACSTPQPQSSVPLDMQTVQAYQQRIASPQTNHHSNHWDLNKKEVEPKVIVIEHRSAKIRPSLHFGHGYHHYGAHYY